MNQITNRQVICDVLMKAAETDRDIVVVCSDSRGSASLAPFFRAFPDRALEVGIAEQNLVTVSAGLAACGKHVFAASPACFLSTRSYEQAKVDVAYSGTAVKLIGISGGVSYGALGMTHHSCQDIAAFCCLPGMRVYLPSDRFLTARLTEALLRDREPAYVRVSRSATEDVYGGGLDFALNRAVVIREGRDVLLTACGEMVPHACRAAEILEKEGVSAGVIDMYCLKPYDEETLLRLARGVRLVVTAEEHAPQGGLGSLTAQALAQHCPRRMLQIALPDAHLIAGTAAELFAHYGMDAAGIAARTLNALKEETL